MTDDSATACARPQKICCLRHDEQATQFPDFIGGIPSRLVAVGTISNLAMGTVHCPGGHTFSDGAIPSPASFRLIPDGEVEALVSEVVQTVHAGGDVEAVVTFKLLSAGFAAYVCPSCGRLLVFRSGLNSSADSYRPE